MATYSSQDNSPNALTPDLEGTSRKQTVFRVNLQLAWYGQGDGAIFIEPHE